MSEQGQGKGPGADIAKFSKDLHQGKAEEIAEGLVRGLTNEVASVMKAGQNLDLSNLKVNEVFGIKGKTGIINLDDAALGGGVADPNRKNKPVPRGR